MSEIHHGGTAVGLDFVFENRTRLYQGMHKGVLKDLYAESFDYASRTVGFTSWNAEPYHDVPFEEVSELVVLPKDSSDFVYEHRDYYIKATVGEVEGVFYAAEHFNLGRGYMMAERDGKIEGVVSSSQLKNPVAVELRETPTTDGGETTGLHIFYSKRGPLPKVLSLHNPEEKLGHQLVYTLEDPAEYEMPFRTQLPIRLLGEAPELSTELMSRLNRHD